MYDSRRNGGFSALVWLLTFAVFATANSMAHAEPTVHHLYRADMPPGFVGRAKSMSSPDRHGYFQPVELRVPDQCLVELASGDAAAPQAGSTRAGLMLGQVYRFKLSNLPQHETQELYPSVEVIDRLHPPPGEEGRFPVPIEITQDDIEAALRGDMVTRVIYVEDPRNAFPGANEKEQRSFDVGAGEDPLRVADDEGRPIAILRLGSRVPLPSDELDEFNFGYPVPQQQADAMRETTLQSADTSLPTRRTPDSRASRKAVPARLPSNIGIGNTNSVPTHEARRAFSPSSERN